MKSVGYRLKKVIELKGLTNYRLSKLSGVSEMAIGRIVNNVSSPNVSTVKSLSSALSVSSDWLLKGEGEMISIENDLNIFEPVKLNYNFEGVPVYDIGFTSGFVELFKENKPLILGFLNTPEVVGSDMIVRANGSSMQNVIDDGDWVGLKRITDLEVISYGSIYGIITQDLQLLKYVCKSQKENNFLLKSENSKYQDFDLPIGKILELYIIKVVLPYSKVKIFV